MTPSCSAATPWISPRAQAAAAVCACACVSAFVYAVDPNRHAVYPTCLFYRTTGFYCAGCGATRALYALLHGQVLRAIHDNALFVAALPVLLGVAGFYLAETWRDNAWPRWNLPGRRFLAGGAMMFVIMVLFMVARNLPGAPFDWLRPL